MKSSTIRRSTLSKESMEVIENLVKQQDEEGGVGEYIRPMDYESSSDNGNNKAQEIDLLWQNFKATQFNTNSPTAYILLGFAIGVLATLILTFGSGYYLSKSGKITFNSHQSQVHKSVTLEQQAESAQDVVEAKISVPTEDEVAPAAEPSQNSEAQNPENASSDNQNFDKSKMKKYVVKSGDTGESIIKHYYGAYSPEKAELLRKVNNLDSLDRINIDQELLIPVE